MSDYGRFTCQYSDHFRKKILPRFSHNSVFIKLASVTRFFWTKFYYRGSFRTNRVSLIGRRCDVIIQAGGSIEFRGRVSIAGYNQLYSRGRLVLGDHVTINEYSRIVSHSIIEIGNCVTIAKFVTIIDHEHDYLFLDQSLVLGGYIASPIRIGNNVLIGDKVSILKGVTIGDNVVIACHSVVNKDVPSNCLVGGVPARVLKTLGAE